MKDASLFLFYAAIALFAFFVVAPMTLNAVSLFTVQKRFAGTMVDEGVVKESDVQAIQPKKQMAGSIISLLVLGLLVNFCIRLAPIGYFCGGVPLLGGFFKYRQVLQFNSLTVERFRNTYRDMMDTAKYNNYVDKLF